MWLDADIFLGMSLDTWLEADVFLEVSLDIWLEAGIFLEMSVDIWLEAHSFAETVPRCTWIRGRGDRGAEGCATSCGAAGRGTSS